MGAGRVPSTEVLRFRAGRRAQTLTWTPDWVLHATSNEHIKNEASSLAPASPGHTMSLLNLRAVPRPQAPCPAASVPAASPPLPAGRLGPVWKQGSLKMTCIKRREERRD